MAITISANGQPADRDLIRWLHDAGVNHVLVRRPTVKTASELVAHLTRIAKAALR